MKITVITLFPEVFEPIINSSILKKAQKSNKVQFELVNLRNFGIGKHQIVDGRPYGGGAGMILRADILEKALEYIMKKNGQKAHIMLMSASGIPYKQHRAFQLAGMNHLIIICGHYEGIDQRFIDKYVLEEISIGDYVLTGGEIAALVVIDSVVRLIPGVLKKPEAVLEESFVNNLLEYPHYTRPHKFAGTNVPTVLLSGNHQKITEWRTKKSLTKTKKIRPDLLK